jgi:predicted phage gp36 major capsid-like protein
MPKTVFENITQTIPGLTSSTDMTGDQFKFVKVSGDLTVERCDTLGEVSIGVLQNKPDVGLAATVATIGDVTKVIATASIASGVRVTTDALGQAVAVGLTQQRIGITLTDTENANELVSILIDIDGLS